MPQPGFLALAGSGRPKGGCGENWPPLHFNSLQWAFDRVVPSAAKSAPAA